MKIELEINDQDAQLLKNAFQLALGFKLKERLLFEPGDMDQHHKITHDTEFYRIILKSVNQQIACSHS